MKRLWFLVAAFLLPTCAQAATFDFSGYVPTSTTGSVTVSSTAVGITTCTVASGSPGTPRALIQVQSNGIWFKVNSATGTPVATDFVAVASDLILLENVEHFRAIRSTSSDATLRVQCLQR